MTRDDILRMADEACNGKAPDGWGVMFDHDQLERFVALVAAAEREACAKAAEAYEPKCDSCPSGVVNAIRERGQE